MEYRYPTIPGTSQLTTSLPRLAADAPPPSALTSPPPPSVGAKQIFAFWHSGIHTLYPYLLREVLSWYRRYSPLGWTIYIFDNVPDSPLNISKYIDTADPLLVPAAFTNDTIDSASPYHHTSDLIRFPLLLRYGGIYLDITLLQIGDLDRLWTEHISNPASQYDFFGFTMSSPPDLQIVNFAMASTPNNPLVARALKILLIIWEGKTNTTGMHAHPLVSHVPLMRVPADVKVPAAVRANMPDGDPAMTDYAIQIQCLGAAERWVHDGWDGPKYTREKCWLYSMVGRAYIPEQMTNWSGQRLFDILSQKIAEPGSPQEVQNHRFAREIVERTVAESWVWKLGNSEDLFGGPTLGLLWRRNEGSDSVEGTYAGWLRWVEVNLKQDTPPERMEVPVFEASMRGKLEDQL